MTHRVTRDRLIIKIFYTACCALAGIILVPLGLATRDPDRWDPGVREVVSLYVIILVVLLPVWVPFARRHQSGAPLTPLGALRPIWGLVTLLAATMVLSFSLALPITFVFSVADWYRGAAVLVALVGAFFIVLLTWDVATGHDLVPPQPAPPSLNGDPGASRKYGNMGP